MAPENNTSQNENGAASPLSGILSTLLSNPDMLNQLRSAFGNNSAPQQEEKAPAEAESAGAPSDDAEGAVPTGAGGSVPPVDGLASVLSDPELMAKLPQMMAMLKPMLAAGDLGKKPNPPPKQHPRSSEDCRNDLLLALKPFLSPERRNAVDAMLRISKLGTVIKQIK